MDHTTAFQEYEQSALEAIAAASDASALEAVRIEFLGKKKGRLVVVVLWLRTGLMFSV